MLFNYGVNLKFAKFDLGFEHFLPTIDQETPQIHKTDIDEAIWAYSEIDGETLSQLAVN